MKFEHTEAKMARILIQTTMEKDLQITSSRSRDLFHCSDNYRRDRRRSCMRRSSGQEETISEK